MESQITSSQLERLRADLAKEKDREGKYKSENEALDDEIGDMSKQMELLEGMLLDYVKPFAELESVVKESEKEFRKKLDKRMTIKQQVMAHYQPKEYHTKNW